MTAEAGFAPGSPASSVVDRTVPLSYHERSINLTRKQLATEKGELHPFSICASRELLRSDSANVGIGEHRRCRDRDILRWGGHVTAASQCPSRKGRRDLSAEHSMRIIVGYGDPARGQARKLSR